MSVQHCQHTYVYWRFEYLTAGVEYHFATRNLRKLVVLPWFPEPDPVMYLVDDYHNIVAQNDDYVGREAEIFYTPTVTGAYRLMIRAYNNDRFGFCDLYRGENHLPPALVQANVFFAGFRTYEYWNQNDVLETSNASGDPYMFVITDDQIYWDDDSGAGNNARWVAPFSGSGIVVLGSYSISTQGECDFWLEPAPIPVGLQGHVTEAISITSEFLASVAKVKDELNQLEPAEREERIRVMQQDVLTTAGVEALTTRPSQEDLKRRAQSTAMLDALARGLGSTGANESNRKSRHLVGIKGANDED